MILKINLHELFNALDHPNVKKHLADPKMVEFVEAVAGRGLTDSFAELILQVYRSEDGNQRKVELWSEYVSCGPVDSDHEPPQTDVITLDHQGEGSVIRRGSDLVAVLKLCAGEPCSFRSDVDCFYRWGEAESEKWCASCRARAALGWSRRGEKSETKKEGK